MLISKNSNDNNTANNNLKNSDIDNSISSDKSKPDTANNNFDEELEDYQINSDINSLNKDNNIIKTGLLNESKIIYHDPYENKSTIYQNTKDKACVYCLFNTVTNEFYIGSSSNGKERFRSYLSPSKIAWAVEHPKDTHGVNLRLARSITKYGYNSFLLLILEEIDKSNLNSDSLKNKLIQREQYFIDLYKPVYNFSLTAGSPNTLGKSLSAEHRAAITKGMLGRIVSPETRERIAATKIGSPES